MVVRRGLRLARSFADMMSMYQPGDLVYIWYVNTQADNLYFVVVKADKRTGKLTLDPGNGAPFIQVTPDEVVPHPATAQRISLEKQKLIEKTGPKILRVEDIEESPDTYTNPPPVGSQIIGPTGNSMVSSTLGVYRGMKGKFSDDHPNDNLKGKDFVVSKTEKDRALLKMGDKMEWATEEDLSDLLSTRSARERNALYHVQKGKVYRKTRLEKVMGKVMCPVCKKSMKMYKFDKGNPIYRCNCGFAIDSKRIIEGPPQLVTPIARRTRDLGEVE